MIVDIKKDIINNFKQEFGDIFTDEEIILGYEIMQELQKTEISLWDLKILIDERISKWKNY